MKMALKGVKVIEFSGLAPVPFCGTILTDFGASVTRIDRLESDNVDVMGNGKKSIALDLKKTASIEIVTKLSKRSDVLIDPFRPGVLEKLGLGPQILCAQNPRLIYSRLTGYGATGSLSQVAGHDINYISHSGLLSLFGRSGQKPTFPINFAADFAGGSLICAMGIIMALYERTISGKGQVIDSNMTEGSAYVGSWLYQSQNSGLFQKERGKNILDSGAHYYEVYETKDGKFMSVGALEPKFYALLLHTLDLTDDEAPYADNETGKLAFAQRFREKTQSEWCQIFNGTDCCVSPVLSIEEAAQHPHNVERESFISKDGIHVPVPAPRLSRTPGSSSAVKGSIRNGQHTVEILKDLGYTNASILDFQKQGVINMEQNKL